MGAVGAGLEISIDRLTDHSEASQLVTGLAITVPVILFLLTHWFLRGDAARVHPVRNMVIPAGAVLILLTSFTSEPVLLTGLVMGALVAVAVFVYGREKSAVH